MIHSTIAVPPPRAVPRSHPLATHLLPLLVAVALAMLVPLMLATGLAIRPAAADNLPFYVGGAVLLGLRLTLAETRSRVLGAVRDTAEWFGLMVLIALLGAVGSYPVSATTHGWADASLQRIDEALRFDWLAWYRATAAHPGLQLAGHAAYQSIYVTPLAIFAHFAWTGRRSEARALIAAFWLAALVTLALFRFMPAVGPLAYLWHGPIPYMPESALWQPQLIPELRHHQMHIVDLGALKGLVSAPSFHTVAALLYIAAAWPHRRLRWPVLAVNVAMLLSTPVEGTHYLADMIAGAGVALFAWWAVAGVRRLAGQSSPGSSTVSPSVSRL